VENETLDDRALEGVWLCNDLSTPMFWMYSFKLRKVVRLSDPRHFDHIFPFLCPEDIPHRIDLSAADICTMHEEDGDTVQRMPLRKSTRFRITHAWYALRRRGGLCQHCGPHAPGLRRRSACTQHLH